MFRTARLLAVTAAAVVGVVPAAHATNADVSDGRAPDAVIAAFDGGWIDLTKGWGEATAYEFWITCEPGARPTSPLCARNIPLR